MRELLITISVLAILFVTTLEAKEIVYITEMDYEIVRLMSSVEDKDYDECLLDNNGVCNVDAEEIIKENFSEKPPKVFKNSNIKRKLKDGTFQEFDGDDYKIVPRNGKRLKKVKAKKRVKPVLIRTVEVPSKNKNSISLLYGRVPSGLKVEETDTSYKAEVKPQDDLQLMYQRDFGDESGYRGSLGISVKGSAYIGLGINF